MTTPDIIDLLAEIPSGSRLDKVRAQRLQARVNAQESYLALFQAVDEQHASRQERFAIAAFVAGLHLDEGIARFYVEQLSPASEGDSLAQIIADEIVRGSARGPYGDYPAGPLSKENEEGPLYRVGASNREQIGERLAAAFEHAHLLVFHPRDASQQALRALQEAGWSTPGIVTLSQLVAFLSFQIRVVAGLRVLQAA